MSVSALPVSSPDSAREVFLAAGMRLYPELGYQHLSVRLLAAEAGLSPGMFHHLFANKEAFVAEVLQRKYDAAFAELQLQVRPGRNVRENLRDALRFLAFFARAHQDWIVRVFSDAPAVAAIREFIRQYAGMRHVSLIIDLLARADAEIAAYRQQQKVAKLELDNAKQMRREDLVSASELAKRQADFERATASVKAAQAARAEAQAAVAQGQAAVAEAEAGVKQATAQADTAASADADMAIRSPLTARVEYRLVEPGTVIGAGSRVISLLDPADVSMNVFLPNATVGGLRVGDEARLVLDGIDAVFPAQVSFIASEAQFTPKAVETADEREKLVFRVKLKVPAEVAQRYDRLLKGGMTGDGYVRRDSSQAWPLALEVRLP